MSTETSTEYRIGTDSSSYSVIERCKVTVTNGKLDIVKWIPKPAPSTARVVNCRVEVEVRISELSVDVWSKCVDDRDEKQNPSHAAFCVHDDVNSDVIDDDVISDVVDDDAITTFDLGQVLHIQGPKILQMTFDLWLTFCRSRDRI